MIAEVTIPEDPEVTIAMMAKQKTFMLTMANRRGCRAVCPHERVEVARYQTATTLLTPSASLDALAIMSRFTNTGASQRELDWHGRRSSWHGGEPTR